MKPINANATVKHFTETNAAGISKSNRIQIRIQLNSILISKNTEMKFWNKENKKDQKVKKSIIKNANMINAKIIITELIRKSSKKFNKEQREMPKSINKSLNKKNRKKYKNNKSGKQN